MAWLAQQGRGGTSQKRLLCVGRSYMTSRVSSTNTYVDYLPYICLSYGVVLLVAVVGWMCIVIVSLVLLFILFPLFSNTIFRSFSSSCFHHCMFFHHHHHHHIYVSSPHCAYVVVYSLIHYIFLLQLSFSMSCCIFVPSPALRVCCCCLFHCGSHQAFILHIQSVLNIYS